MEQLEGRRPAAMQRQWYERYIRPRSGPHDALSHDALDWRRETE